MMVSMSTITVTLPDEVFKSLKNKAESEDRTLESLSARPFSATTALKTQRSKLKLT